jgi:hypothetical protein
MIPVTYHNGELAGIMSYAVPGFGEAIRHVEFMYLAFEDQQNPFRSEYKIVKFDLGWWARQHGQEWLKMPCLVAPEGWTLNQLRLLKHFR